MARKEKMKIYHGVPKSITDEHTIFYSETPYTKELRNLPTGYGSKTTGKTTTTKSITPTELTIDFWLYAEKLKESSGGHLAIVETFNGNSESQFRLVHDQNNLYVIYPNFNWNNGYKVPLNTYIHIRAICIDNKVELYVNGKLHWEKTNTNFSLVNNTKSVNFLSGAHDDYSSIYISDVHVSSINRGDYFPNLPQDFIDGKAVIKPRMGQQQIKGDPMHSQVTTLKVPSQPKELIGTIYDLDLDSDNTTTNIKNPELRAGNCHIWSSNSKIKIKGLQGEIISGVVDTDTALARVVKSNLDKWNILTIHVDDVSKFAVNDTITLYIPVSGYYSSQATIKSINEEEKSITLTSKLLSSDGGTWGVIDLSVDPIQYIFETTPSSSSPTVKMKDGTNVVGTWSGLGTKQAVFTLGENTDISGKDLYIEYTLNTLLGKSDFPQLPHEVQRAYNEYGVEMKPVDEIMIVDDFKGKVTGSLDECPHYASFVASNSLKNPDYFTPDSYMNYRQLENLDDNSVGLSNTSNGNIGQVLLSYDLISIVERKLGESIPSRDKVQWIKENLSSVVVDIMCFGSGASGNKVNATVFFADTNLWNGAVWTHSNTSLANLNCAIGSSNMRRIVDTTGRLHFLVYATASNSTIPTVLRIDYTKITLTLKNDSTYTSLYCDNKRAREDVCNPVLVQKETKTVKRYLPSKESFSTECLYAKFKNEGVVNGLDILVNKHINIGVTTSEYNKFVSGSKINLNQLPLEKSEHLYTPILDYNIMDSIPKFVGVNITELPIIHWWSDNGDKLFTVPTTETLNLKTCVSDTNAIKGQRGGYKDANNNVVIYGDVDKSNILTEEGLRLYDISLVNKDGELMLYVIKSSEGKRFYIYNDAITLIKVPHRPLIK